MNILTFGATTHLNSLNQLLSQQVGDGLKGSAVKHLRLSDFELPLYSQDLEESHGIPAPASALLDAIQQAELIVISFAEHNGSYTAAYKNAFDWMSRIQQKVYLDKKVVALAASPGPGGAKNVLQQAVTSLPFFGAKVVHHESVATAFDKIKDGNFDQSVIDDIVKNIRQKLL